jgi:hypothetical protein
MYLLIIGICGILLVLSINVVVIIAVLNWIWPCITIQGENYQANKVMKAYDNRKKIEYFYNILIYGIIKFCTLGFRYKKVVVITN